MSSFEYLGRTIPDDDDVFKELLRKEAHRVLVENRRDEKPPGALDWVSGLVQSHPEQAERVEKIYEELLAEADPVEVREILWQGDQHPRRKEFVGVLVDVISGSAITQLRAKSDTTQDNRSLLGAIVERLSALSGQKPRLSVAAVRSLGKIDDQTDGWPTSLLLALDAEYDGYSSQLIPAIERVVNDDDHLASFAAAMVNAGPPLATRGFDDIGRLAPPALRAQFASAVENFLKSSERARQDLISFGIADRYPANIRDRITDSRPLDAWPDFAKRLRVTAESP